MTPEKKKELIEILNRAIECVQNNDIVNLQLYVETTKGVLTGVISNSGDLVLWNDNTQGAVILPFE